ncbi:Nucleic acid-binding, OB-fold [Artemisia annua]|uniref:Eukaryotic translation initiation factor 4C n=1 Tax=Artemisia annua TaxID=35608 RepID=A0A2U1MUJ8_ARTAN|nr:Nucleic acid-binding, OB-fold [Artemisia annua]
MPKNKGKGGKNRKRGKNEADDEKRELVFKEDGQEYAQVLRMLGNGRCEVMCIDGTKRLSHIRGKMHKKVWIAAGDIILVGLRDYQDDKSDVILKYMPDEARLLKAYGELPENIRLNEGIAGGIEDEDDIGGDNYIEFLKQQFLAGGFNTYEYKYRKIFGNWSRIIFSAERLIEYPSNKATTGSTITTNSYIVGTYIGAGQWKQRSIYQFSVDTIKHIYRFHEKDDEHDDDRTSSNNCLLVAARN